MNCNLNRVVALILGAIAALLAAIGLANLWPTAYPLFAAAALVAGVAYVAIPAIKQALLDYAACRGGAGKCASALNLTIDTLGQVAATISAITFAAAGALQIAALAAIFSGFLAFLGVGAEAAVVWLVRAGTFACAIAILLLLGVLTNANGFKSCLDGQSGNLGPTTAGTLE